MSLKSVADEYFSSINPIASRLYADMNETKAAYDKLWLNLSQEQQDQILNESIIKPEACLQYSSIRCKGVRKEEFAVKTVMDDNCSYRDEHSAPFSFRTPSQRDLTIFKDKEPTKLKAFEEVHREYKLKKEFVSETHISHNDDSLQESQNSLTSLLPKTGLDFLDNW